MALFSWRSRKDRKKPARRDSGDNNPQRSYQGVEIIPGKKGACEAARKLAGKRLLASEAPLFPLPDCDRAECNCTYKHFPDRRTDMRRGVDVGLTSTTDIYRQIGKDRRSGKRGRRTTDREPE